MKKLSSEARRRRLVELGLMPAIAEQVVADVDGRGGRVLDVQQAGRQAESEPIEVTAERTAAWVMYSPDVPDELRRMPFARVLRAGPS